MTAEPVKAAVPGGLSRRRRRPLSLGGQTLPAAGLPWFVAMFGRDSILTCLQVVPFAPEMSRAGRSGSKNGSIAAAHGSANGWRPTSRRVG